MRRQDSIPLFVKTIWQWYAVCKRELPWRDLQITNDAERAYRILVSEVMLQQTQVNRVKIVYRNFLEQFPTAESLAQASNTTVIQAWRGMGYNNRALRLRDAAQEIQKHKIEHATFPTEMNQLMSLPGVGHYTAAAIRNFGFNLPTPCLDTNIRRILHRSFIGPENPDGTWQKDDVYLLSLAGELLNEACKAGDARNWHAALMDYGSLVCTMRSPKWDICPLTKAGLMKAAFKTPAIVKKQKVEPGRVVAGKHIPNRIFRGKIVEELRDEPGGLTLSDIGSRICIDWHEDEHRQWLTQLIDALKKDQLIKSQRGRLVLA